MLVNASCPTHRPQSFVLVTGHAISTSSTEPNSTLHFASVSHRYFAHQPCRNPTRQLRGSRKPVNWPPLSTPTLRSNKKFTNRNLLYRYPGYPTHGYLSFESLAPSPLGLPVQLVDSMRHTRSLSLAGHYASSRTCIPCSKTSRSRLRKIQGPLRLSSLIWTWRRRCMSPSSIRRRTRLPASLPYMERRVQRTNAFRYDHPAARSCQYSCRRYYPRMAR